MALLFKHDSPLRGIWKLEESSSELLTILDNTADYQSFLDKVSAEKRRQEYLASRVLLKELLGKEALVEYHPNGAPFLPREPLYISISHTKDYVAVILDEHPTGIDIEYRSDRILKIRSRFMNPDEEVGINLIHEVDHLLIHWCAKETLFKVMGEENVDFQRHLHIKPFLYAERGIFVGHETRTPNRMEYEFAFEVTSDYVLTWCL